MRRADARAVSGAHIAWAVFLVSFLAYWAAQSGSFEYQDATPNAFLPASILGDGDLAFGPIEAPFMFVWSVKNRSGGQTDFSLDRWDRPVPGTDVPAWKYHDAGLLEFHPRYYLVPTIRRRAGTGEPLFVGAFGPATGLTAVPLAAAAQALGVPVQQSPTAAYAVAGLTAKLLTAASVAMVFLTALGLTTRRRALALAAAYGLGTCVWSISSHSLWQQTAELFFLSLGVLLVARGESAWVRGAAAGLALSAAAACRPTAAIVALAAAVYLLLCDRRAAMAFVLAALPAAIGVLAYNAWYFGSPVEFGQLVAGATVAKYKTGSADVWQTPLWLGAAGLLFSPSRGLLVYSPFLAAAFVGAALAWRGPRYAALRFLTFAVTLLWVPAFVWFDWWGGWTYGYRPIVDSAPLLAVLCVPGIEWLCAPKPGRYALVAAVAWSGFVQLLGVVLYTPADWNARGIGAGGTMATVDLPQSRSRLWSWRDWQIGYLMAKLSDLQSGAR